MPVVLDPNQKFKINALKKIEYQILKNLSYTPSDEQKVSMAQSLLNAIIGNDDVINNTIVDSELPTTLFGAALDWTAGGVDESTVGISLGAFSVTQDLSVEVNEPITSGGLN